MKGAVEKIEKEENEGKEHKYIYRNVVVYIVQVF